MLPSSSFDKQKDLLASDWEVLKGDLRVKAFRVIKVPLILELLWQNVLFFQMNVKSCILFFEVGQFKIL